MDLQPLIESIVNSENPVVEFSKVAEELDDRWKVTLAREVNKALFSKSLQESDLNSNIEFDVIELPKMTKMASYNKSNGNFTKTASNKTLTKTAELKKKQITPMMYSFQEINYSKNIKASGDNTSFEKVAAEREAKFLEVERVLRKEAEERKALFVSYKAKEEKDLLLQKIAKELSSDIHELKFFVVNAVKNGLEKEAELVLKYAKPDLKYMQKVAHKVSSIDKQKMIDSLIDELKILDKIASLPMEDRVSLYDEIKKKSLLDKEAAIRAVTETIKSIPGIASNITGRAVSLGLRIPGKIARTAIGVGKFAKKHPILTTAGISGIVGAIANNNAIDNVIVGR